MRISHVALVSSSEKKANQFYRDLLGLNVLRSTLIPANLSRSLFGVDQELKVIDFGNEQLKFEVFIADHEEALSLKRLDHICLEVEDRETLLKKCREMGLEVLQVPKGDSLVVFIKDGDRNRFEVKEKK